MFSKANRFESKSAKEKSSSTTSSNAKKPVCFNEKLPGKATNDGKPIIRSEDTCSVAKSASSSFKAPFASSTPSLSAVKKKAGVNMLVKRSNTSSSMTTKSSSVMCMDRVGEKDKSNKMKNEYQNQLHDLKSTIEELEKKLKDSHNARNALNEELIVSQTHEQLKLLTLRENSSAIQDSHKEKLDTEIATLMSQNNLLRIGIKNFGIEVNNLKDEIHTKQIDMLALEELITIRDSLCKDLQNKLDEKQKESDDILERLNLVKGHLALASEANESIRKEYKVELDTLKAKFDEDQQTFLNRMRIDNEAMKQRHKKHVETIEEEHKKQVERLKVDFSDATKAKETQMDEKLKQLEEQFREQIRLSEIQFEEENRCQQAHWKKQLSECQKIAEDEVTRSELEIKRLTESLEASEFRSRLLTNNINSFRLANDSYKEEIKQLTSKLNCNNGNREYEVLISELRDKFEEVQREKRRYEMALKVSRDALEILGARLLRSDHDVENMNKQLQYLSSTNLNLETELASLRNDFDEVTVERNEYREALANIINSKNIIDQAHNNIMSQNRTVMETLEEMENRTYDELNTIKNEIILRMGGTDTDTLFQVVANQLSSLEERNLLLEEQAKEGLMAISELSSLRMENEELMSSVSRQASIIDKLKREVSERDLPPKSPLSKKQMKSVTPGKENMSPLRERNF